ncbi:carbohydrate porin [Rhodoplanes serenus]|uniref:carbohydrate porin n=1 Tax=Rhodoplanes serenus TaxID=200615 RepID=UPI000DACBAFB|nr:carbohydrate porin [Rhodoplanes serenus]RAI33593.1 porin [Rhodoplanes serenus]
MLVTRRILNTASGLALLVGASNFASAADLQPRPSWLPSSPAPYDWNGFHLGAHFGYATGRSDWSAVDTAGGVSAGTVDMFNAYEAFKGTGSYSLGLQAGYTHVLPSRLMLGIEVDVSAPNLIGGARPFETSAAGPVELTARSILSGTVRGRIGYAFDHWLLYGTAGFAWSYDRLSLTTNPGAALGEEEADGTVAARLWRLGYAVGGGVEIPLSPAWTARAEYLYTGFGAQQVAWPTVGHTVSSDLSLHSIRLGLNYHIGEATKIPNLLSDGLSPLEQDRIRVHGQSTFTIQYAAPFRSPYSGPNSFQPNIGRQTWDVTFYLGARLWEGAELWVNPEIDQGFGLSNTFGIAGFPSAEAYKVGSAYPYARLTRTFLRQTIDLGGEIEKVEGGANQFGGSQSSDRLVFTVGKFSSVDIFDTNKYAHDPRTDFLNWAVVDTATFDYAADAWAFTYGAAVEWYRGPWTVRAGVFDLPKVPNSTDLDPTFQQFQLIGEVERRYTLRGLPGKIAVTGFLSRARLGRFEDAVLLGQATGTTPELAAVRRYTGKTGLSANLEQQITRDIGVFARAGFNDRELETNAFTDVDRTAVLGAALSGRLWGRPDDTVGIAGVVNQIGASHIAYLDAGGLTAILGDGKLPNPGLEKIVEVYYSLPVASWRVTLDYQFIANPAYNTDRGPVSIFGTRLRTAF